jgi:hypothetical protein
MGQYDPRQMVFIDEAGVDDHTNVRKHGWAPLGQACVRRTSFLRGQKYVILPALSLDGILTLDIYEGSVNRECFLEFLRNHLVCTILVIMTSILKLLKQAPHLNPFPMEWSVVVMDNCSIHHDEDIRRIIEDECGMCYIIVANLILNPRQVPSLFTSHLTCQISIRLKNVSHS